MPTYLKPGGLNVESKQLFEVLKSREVSYARDSTDDAIKLFYVNTKVWMAPDCRFFVAKREGDGLSSSILEVFVDSDHNTGESCLQANRRK
eukprot:m.486044 g.486044  ORF g.486044 m.486044 type:complete len:91 (-) comp76283_c0_seq1:33-305(-)